jgi:hypothetical protein
MTSSTNEWANPIGSGLIPERIDQGVDYGGRGNLYAIGPGVIKNLYNSGWPGGTFLTEKLSATGQYVYYAEDVTPMVKVGQSVTAGQKIAVTTGGSSGLEIGWAAPPGTGNTMAMNAGQTRLGQSQGDPGKYTTGYGLGFNQLLTSLGAPGGQINPPVQGSAPPGYSGGVGTTGISWNPFTDLNSLANTIISSVLKAFGVPNFGNLFIRLGLILFGALLVILGLVLLTRQATEVVISSDVGKAAKTAATGTTEGNRQ